jgi:hypothetical protein
MSWQMQAFCAVEGCHAWCDDKKGPVYLNLMELHEQDLVGTKNKNHNELIVY